MDKRVTAAHILTACAETYRERNKSYGDSYYRHGKAMLALYPGGVTLKTVHDFNRFGIVNMLVSKLMRYTTDPAKPHLDSVHDLAVYAAMLEEVDRNEPSS